MAVLPSALSAPFIRLEEAKLSPLWAEKGFAPCCSGAPSLGPGSGRGVVVVLILHWRLLIGWVSVVDTLSSPSHPCPDAGGVQ